MHFSLLQKIWTAENIPKEPPARALLSGCRPDIFERASAYYDWRDDPYYSTPALLRLGGDERVIHAMQDIAGVISGAYPAKAGSLSSYDHYLYELSRFANGVRDKSAEEVWDGQRHLGEPPISEMNDFLLSNAPAELKIKTLERIGSVLHDHFDGIDSIAWEQNRAEREAQERIEREHAVKEHDKKVLAPQIARTNHAQRSQAGVHRKLDEIKAKLTTAKHDLTSALHDLDKERAKNAALKAEVDRLKELLNNRQQPRAENLL